MLASIVTYTPGHVRVVLIWLTAVYIMLASIVTYTPGHVRVVLIWLTAVYDERINDRYLSLP